MTRSVAKLETLAASKPYALVRRQRFWDRRWLKIRDLAPLVVILSGLPTVQQAAIADCLSFDRFAFNQNGLATSEIDVGGRQVADALVISQVIVVGDEGGDPGLRDRPAGNSSRARYGLKRLMPALDLALGHRMIRRAAGMLHVLPSSHLARSAEM